MVFIEGPRQVGKTTLAKAVLSTASPGEFKSMQPSLPLRIINRRSNEGL
ncbi:MAG: hypothetical protein L6247_05670 [Desulfobacteraceae bacterium]|nr:hypothetical protein [Pseudomonadota bacterium]MCG2755036.1 hypothetical protein [Desulfobacteraceae bacterium]